MIKQLEIRVADSLTESLVVTKPAVRRLLKPTYFPLFTQRQQRGQLQAQALAVSYLRNELLNDEGRLTITR